jgi:2-keto-4-pentenoate hydratase/2-oxohepta-3-ene-1,7-dioic acid hydratase in catechol pathway
MKLVTFEIASVLGPFHRIGVLDGEQILDVAAAYSARLRSEMTDEAASEVATATIGRTMIDFFARGTSARDAAQRALEFARESGNDELEGSGGERVWHTPSDVSLKAPVPRPNTLRDCTGFLRHMETFAKASDTQAAGGELLTKRPLYYKANPEMVLSPDTEIPWPTISDKLDVEIEPAFYIGKRGRNIRVEDANEYIAGYTIFNDVSLRDVQVEEIGLAVNPWGLSKSKDAGGYPMGPCVVTPDEVDSRDLELVVRVNGE